MKMQTKAFTEHVDRVGEQYSQIKKLKENIQENEFIVQMDFAENFSCQVRPSSIPCTEPFLVS
jgi:hypothetical protein